MVSAEPDTGSTILVMILVRFEYNPMMHSIPLNATSFKSRLVLIALHLVRSGPVYLNE